MLAELTSCRSAVTWLMQHHGDVESDTQALKPTGRANARLGQTVKDMVWSMIVVLAVVAVILILAWRPEPNPVRSVDPLPTVALSAAQADYDVKAPTGLSEEWVATSARWEPTDASQGQPILHIGYVTPSGGYAQLTEYATTDTTLDALQRTPLFRERVGIVTLDAKDAGSAWTTGSGREGAVLLSLDQGRFIALTGTATPEELRVLADSLRSAN